MLFTELCENLTHSLVADPMSLTDGRGLHIRNYFICRKLPLLASIYEEYFIHYRAVVSTVMNFLVSPGRGMFVTEAPGDISKRAFCPGQKAIHYLHMGQQPSKHKGL
jgi:hypothetical protein